MKEDGGPGPTCSHISMGCDIIYIRQNFRGKRNFPFFQRLQGKWMDLTALV